jgi:flavin-dependent dehydrogenase/intein/homing endonuclease
MIMEFPKEVDVIVVGVGPGGAGAAKRCAELGLKVLAVEKRAEIGAPKRCGEAISRHGMTERIGIKPEGPWIMSEVNGATVFSPNGKSITIDYKGPEGWVVERKLFDKHLAALAANAGARVIAKTEARKFVRKDGKVNAELEYEGQKFNVTAKIVIAADGVESLVARELGVNTANKLIDLCAGAQFEMAGVKGLTNMIEFYFSVSEAPGGYCVTPNTEIITKNTVKPITDVKIGEEVLSLDGWTPTEAASVRDYEGDIISLKPYMLNNVAELTPDHLVYVWSKRKGFSWKKACDLKRGRRGEHRDGDYLVTPIPKEKKIEFLTLEDYASGILSEGRLFPKGRNRYCPEFKYKYGIPNRIKLTDELMEFFGYYVSEGSINSSGIIISNTNEKIVERVKTIGENTFGVKACLYKGKNTSNPEKPCIQVTFPSVILRQTFKAMFKEGSHNKVFPRFFAGLDDDLKKAFLTGLFRGDGDKYRKTTGLEHLEYTSVSKSLIYDMWMLLASMGIVGTIGRMKKKNAYRLRIYGHQLDCLDGIFGKCNHGKMINNKFLIKDGFVLVGVDKKETKRYKGKVYDIQSNGSFCPGFIIHNCWVFNKGNGVANVGIGVRKPWAKKTALQYLEEWVAKQTRFRDASVLEVNSGGVPVGGFLQDSVADNLMIVGDAAHHVNPIHGGGIPEAYMAGRLAAETAAEAVKANDFSKKFLKKYDKVWEEQRGKKLKKILKLREVMESMSDDDLNWLVDYIKPQDLVDFAQGGESSFVKFAKLLMKKPKLMKLAGKLV